MGRGFQKHKGDKEGMKFRDYIKEAKKLDAFVLSYPEVDTKKDGIKILEDIRKYINKNYDGVTSTKVLTSDVYPFITYTFETGKTTGVFKKRPEENMIVISWEKYPSDTYKGKQEGTVWSITYDDGSHSRYIITNFNDLDKSLKKSGAMKI